MDTAWWISYYSAFRKDQQPDPGSFSFVNAFFNVGIVSLYTSCGIKLIRTDFHTTSTNSDFPEQYDHGVIRS